MSKQLAQGCYPILFRFTVMAAPTLQASIATAGSDADVEDER